MIARICGILEEVRSAGMVVVSLGGGLWYEVLVPASDLERLTRRLNGEVVFHTIHYFEGDPSHGQVTPRLIGFLTEADRDFFRAFTTVKGIGVRKALRALVRPVAEIAAAIAAKDTALLKALPEIGPRTAERIVVELHGKVDAFVGELAAETEAQTQLPQAASQAVAVLVQLGERRGDAQALIERVLAVSPETQTPEELIQQAYRLKVGSR